MVTVSLRRLRSAVKKSRRWLRGKVRSRSPRRLRRTIAAYRGARRSLVAPVSSQSRHALDWLNFFLADVQTGFGSFVAFYPRGSGVHSCVTWVPVQQRTTPQYAATWDHPSSGVLRCARDTR
jgi:hypothetical protein